MNAKSNNVQRNFTITHIYTQRWNKTFYSRCDTLVESILSKLRLESYHCVIR